MKETTFSQDCLKAIAHLSRSMQDRIIADVTRYRLTGEVPEKMPAMRLALFKALILMLEAPGTANDNTSESETSSRHVAAENTADATDGNDKKDETPKPNYVAIDPLGNTMPLYIPTPAPSTPEKVTRADRRRLQRAIS